MATESAPAPARLMRIAREVGAGEEVELLAFGQRDTEPTRGIAVPAAIAYPVIALLRRATADKGTPARYWIAVTGTHVILRGRGPLGGVQSWSREMNREDVAHCRRIGVGGTGWHRVALTLTGGEEINLGVFGDKADALCGLLSASRA